MGPKSGTVEEKIARIASTAHGVVTRVELLAARVTAKQIKSRVAKGALIPEYAGVYRAGHCAPSTEARYMAATKAGGDGALLCGPAGGYLLGILKSPSPPPPEILTPTERNPKGLKARRSKSLDRRDA